MKRLSLIIITAVIAWFLLAEVGTEAWFRYKESQVTETQAWPIAFPEDAEVAGEFGLREFSARDLTGLEQEILRFDEATAGSWRDSAGNFWSAFLLEWEPDNRLNQNDLSHNPTSCLPAAGMKLVSREPDVMIPINGIDVPFLTWVFERDGRRVYVFMASRKQHDFEMLELTRDRRARMLERFRKPLLGMRGNPLQTIQLFVAGPATVEAAAELARQQVAQLEKVGERSGNHEDAMAQR